jgi:Zn-dependent protease
MMIIILISIDIHELAHAVVADRLGDPTPRRMGEVSLNPFVHMDQIGLMLLVLTSLGSFGFTYGRTHVTPTNLKFGPQRGNAIVAVAGPLSNIAVAAILAGVISIKAMGDPLFAFTTVGQFLLLAMVLNILLFVFNLIPIPPLDGFSVVGGFLTARQMYSLAPLQQWGPLLILVLFIADPQIGIISGIITPIRDQILQILCSACLG